MGELWLVVRWRCGHLGRFGEWEAARQASREVCPYCTPPAGDPGSGPEKWAAPGRVAVVEANLLFLEALALRELERCACGNRLETPGERSAGQCGRCFAGSAG